MAMFQYTAMGFNEKEKKGEMEADNDQAVGAALKEQGLFPTSIKEIEDTYENYEEYAEKIKNFNPENLANNSFFEEITSVTNAKKVAPFFDKNCTFEELFSNEGTSQIDDTIKEFKKKFGSWKNPSSKEAFFMDGVFIQTINLTDEILCTQDMFGRMTEHGISRERSPITRDEKKRHGIIPNWKGVIFIIEHSIIADVHNLDAHTELVVVSARDFVMGPIYIDNLHINKLLYKKASLPIRMAHPYDVEDRVAPTYNNENSGFSVVIDVPSDYDSDVIFMQGGFFFSSPMEIEVHRTEGTGCQLRVYFHKSTTNDNGKLVHETSMIQCAEFDMDENGTAHITNDKRLAQLFSVITICTDSELCNRLHINEHNRHMETMVETRNYRKMIAELTELKQEIVDKDVIIAQYKKELAEKIANLFKSCEKNISTMDNMADYLSVYLRGAERELLGDGGKSQKGGVIDENIKKSKFNFGNHPIVKEKIQVKKDYLDGLALLINVDEKINENKKSYLSKLVEAFYMPQSFLDDLIKSAKNSDADKFNDIMSRLKVQDDVKINFMVDVILMTNKNKTVHENETELIEQYFEILSFTSELKNKVIDIVHIMEKKHVEDIIDFYINDKESYAKLSYYFNSSRVDAESRRDNSSKKVELFNGGFFGCNVIKSLNLSSQSK